MQTWQIEWDDRARKELRSLDFPVQEKILKYLREKISINPKAFGKELSANLSGLWRFRVEAYRIICRINEHEIKIFVIAVGHRKDVYD